jgi:hypothetical protein
MAVLVEESINSIERHDSLVRSGNFVNGTPCIEGHEISNASVYQTSNIEVESRVVSGFTFLRLITFIGMEGVGLLHANRNSQGNMSIIDTVSWLFLSVFRPKKATTVLNCI